MKLLATLKEKIGKKEEKPQELYLTLIVDSDHVAGACWHPHETKAANLTHAVARRITIDSWEERTKAADEVITALEERSQTTNIHKVIFGFPAAYLSPEGDIDKAVKSELKQFTEALELTPIGFVPVHQALVYTFKKEDGVPPTVILIGVYRKEVVVAVYKVGVCIGMRTIPNMPDRVPAIERFFKELTGVEVLPSRILLFGANPDMLEDLRSEMIGHPWPTRANFLHFPKIVILPADTVVSSVSVAGSGELPPAQVTADMSEHMEVHPPSVRRTVNDTAGRIDEPPEADEETIQEEIRIRPDTKPDEGLSEVPPMGHSVYGQNGQQQESRPEETEGKIEEESEKTETIPEESNVRVVSPEEIGFRRNADILSMETRFPSGAEKKEPLIQRRPERVSGQPMPTGNASHRSSLVSRVGPAVFSFLRGFRGGKFPILPLFLGGAALIGLVAWIVLSVAPKATITITIVPKTIEASSSAIIDPGASAPDPQSMTIPGEKLEKTVSGEKTVPVTGKKSVGDPAKGAVSIYNKTLTPRTFKKGTVIVSNSLQFTLDSEVQIASATETIGSITFGKGTASVTASAIGTKSNLAANAEFSFKDISDSIAIARNEQAFSGGTSREVTVVSRADMDGLVTAITPELVDKAKQNLSSGIAGSKKLIPETIKTTVAEKTFTEELNQEATELHGKVSMNVSGIVYDESIFGTLLSEKAKGTIPKGYELVSDSITITIGKLTVKKSGGISASVSFSGKAIPSLKPEELKSVIAGKTVDTAISTLRALPGVSNVSVTFKSALLKRTIPKAGNITIRVTE